MANQIKIFSTLFFCLCISIACAQSISGMLLSQKEPVSYATVSIQNNLIGTVSDYSGRFKIETSTLPDSTITLQIRALGYETKLISLHPPFSNSIALGNIELREDVLKLNEVVVTGSMEDSYLRESPVKTEVISQSLIQKFIPAQNIVESVALINGVQEVNACGVCYTNSISINSLPGYYTALLMDGTPIYGSLAAIYGLNSIPSIIIDRVEITRGPNSTLYGSEAMAGVINIITKSGTNQPLISTELLTGSLNNTSLNTAISVKNKNWHNYTGISANSASGYFDLNNDKFSDRPNYERISVFNKIKFIRPVNRELNLSARLYFEDRRNGVEQYMLNRAYNNYKGSNIVYGESILTRRGEIFGSYDFSTTEKFKLDFSASYHHQKSWYGNVFYEATQQTAFSNFTWRKKTGRHFVLAGLTMREQFYVDNTPVSHDQNIDKLEFTPGIFIQNEWNATKKLSVLGGTRFDYYQKHGLIWSPRLSLKQEIGKWTNIRLNSGTGFRAVNLLTEDHAFISSQREIVIESNLNPEKSINTTLGVNHLYKLAEQSGTIELDVFYNHFTNRIIPDYSEPDKIKYLNSSGNVQSFGAGIYLNHRFNFPLNIQGGFNLQRIQRSEKDEQQIVTTSLVEFAPIWTSLLLCNYQHIASGISVSYTMKATGPMQLPLVYDVTNEGEQLPEPRPTRSKPFSLHHIQLAKKFSKINLELFGGVQNLLNYRQPESPLVAFNDNTSPPGFSQHFDTSYTYSPLTGSEFFIGVRWSSRK